MTVNAEGSQQRSYFLFLSLVVVLVIAGTLLFFRAAFGPAPFMLPIRSPLNGECVIAVAFVLGCLLRSVPATATQSVFEQMPRIAAYVLVVGLSVGCYASSLRTPFLFDDYTHLANARDESFSVMLARALVIHPNSGDYFFRPLTYVSYWIDGHWAAVSPLGWHLWNVALHTGNCLLVYRLARAWFFSSISATIAAVTFACGGVHVEVVCWMAARFDLLASFFTLGSLIAFNAYIRSSKASELILVLVSASAACLSKESGFAVIPLLLVNLLFVPVQQRRQALRCLAGVCTSCLFVFCYRQWFLGGIGGYRSVGGQYNIWQFSVLRTTKALFFRQWGILWSPINWSLEPERWLAIALFVMAVISVILLLYARTPRRQVLAALLFVLAASLPVQHLLLIGTDLAGARLLYLPSVGIALLWGTVVGSLPKLKLIVAAAVGLSCFQVASLVHNMRIWNEVASWSRQSCSAVGDSIRATGGPVYVQSLPHTERGIFFLSNGFPQCVQIQSGQTAAHVQIGSSPSLQFPQWEWNEQGHRMKLIAGRAPTTR